ncbi:unnamed protein product [Vicia faba]|uniref:Uncharacterized protein n=1 Tax=Vicia faba TaxID=3906 RepID=A0AAV0YNT0_VICFA|nr:unnamed protein product [Vicia faba]
MKCRYFTKEESHLIDTMITCDDDATIEESDSIVTSDVEEATKETKADARFLFFLEKDDSFLSPWSWNPNNAFNNDNVSTKENKYFSFHPESYFTYRLLIKRFKMKMLKEIINCTPGKNIKDD